MVPRIIRATKRLGQSTLHFQRTAVGDIVVYASPDVRPMLTDDMVRQFCDRASKRIVCLDSTEPDADLASYAAVTDPRFVVRTIPVAESTGTLLCSTGGATKINYAHKPSQQRRPQRAVVSAQRFHSVLAFVQIDLNEV